MSRLKAAVRNTALKFGPTKKFYNLLEEIKHKRLMKKYSTQPVNGRLVMFEAYKGRSFACSPKAIYLEMLNDPDFADTHFVWVFNSPEKQTELKRMPRTTVTHKLSPEHIEAALTAGIIVTNSRLVRALPQRPGQFVLQTWHGTPLKRLGLDIAIEGKGVESLEEIHREYKKDGELLSALLSPSPYATEHLASAFGLPADSEKIWETGYPRNDFLFNFTEEDVKKVRERLGIPKGKKVILYAPTFRDKDFVRDKGYHNILYADLERLKKCFGDEYVLILRKHYFAAEGDYPLPEDFVIDGNTTDDINELYIVSDILITDYSSVMYDYAALKRPMVFFMPDLDEYRNSIRDFYMDPQLLPGPVITTQEELENELDAIAGGRTETDFDAFLARFQPYEDGKRAAEVVGRLKRATGMK